MYQKNIDHQRARDLILRRIKRDKIFHEQGQWEKMGESCDDFDAEFPRGYPDLMIAWTFWDAWIEERNHGFPNLYEGITKESWPQLAAHIIEQLEKKEKITQIILLKHFDFSEQPDWFEKWKEILKNIFSRPPVQKKNI